MLTGRMADVPWVAWVQAHGQLQLFGWLGPAIQGVTFHAILFGFLGVLTAGLTGRLPTAFLDVGERGIAATRMAYRITWILIVLAALLRVAGPLAGTRARP